MTTTPFRPITESNTLVAFDTSTGNVKGLVAPNGNETDFGTGGGALGPVPDVGTLNSTYPPASNAGQSALVGASAPYAIYDCNGTAWAVRGNAVPPVASTAFIFKASLSSYNAVKGRSVEDLVTNGTTVVTSATASFSQSDVGSIFRLVSSTTTNNRTSGTIVSVQSATQCTLSVAPTFSETAVGMVFGPDNATALSNAVSSLGVLQSHSTLWVPEGAYLTSAAIVLQNGQSLQGDGRSYGYTQYGQVGGSALILGGSVGGTAFVTLGNNATDFTAGRTAGVIDSITIDAVNGGFYAVEMKTRRSRIQDSSVWRGTTDTLKVSAQNANLKDIIAGSQNVGNVITLANSDIKIFGGEARQGGSATPSASTGHQIYAFGAGNCLIEGVHLYAGFNGNISSSYSGSDVMIRNCSGFVISGCSLDGTYGPHVAVRVDSGATVSNVVIANNNVFQVSGYPNNRFGIVELQPVSGAIRGVQVLGNSISTLATGFIPTAMVSKQNLDGTQTGLAGSLSHIVVRDNLGISAPAPWKNFTPDVRGGNVCMPSGGTTVVLDENSGNSTFNGTGAQTVFNIPHGLFTTPSVTTVTAGSSAASSAYSVTSDGTNVIVTYATAPASGTNNVILNWYAKV